MPTNDPTPPHDPVPLVRAVQRLMRQRIVIGTSLTFLAAQMTVEYLEAERLDRMAVVADWARSGFKTYEVMQ